jgi:hypothetical protein
VQRRVREERVRPAEEGWRAVHGRELEAAAAAARAVKCSVVATRRGRQCSDLRDGRCGGERAVRRAGANGWDVGGEGRRAACAELIRVWMVLLEWAQRASGPELLWL